MRRTGAFFRTIAIAGFAGACGLAGWAVIDAGIHATSGVEFCSSCHTMEPMAAAYALDVHGGANANGVRAECSDCHLPHDGPIRYLVAKTRLGVHDVWVEFTGDTEAIDWQALRTHRERYVHDSGCLTCHSDLQRATRSNSRAFVAHKPYFLGQTARSCVSCHEHVGHAELERFLPAPASTPASSSKSNSRPKLKPASARSGGNDPS